MIVINHVLWPDAFSTRTKKDCRHRLTLITAENLSPDCNKILVNTEKTSRLGLKAMERERERERRPADRRTKLITNDYHVAVHGQKCWEDMANSFSQDIYVLNCFDTTIPLQHTHRQHWVPFTTQVQSLCHSLAASVTSVSWSSMFSACHPPSLYISILDSVFFSCRDFASWWLRFDDDGNHALFPFWIQLVELTDLAGSHLTLYVDRVASLSEKQCLAPQPETLQTAKQWNFLIISFVCRACRASSFLWSHSLTRLLMLKTSKDPSCHLSTNSAAKKFSLR